MMRNLGFGVKASIISFVFVLPLTILAWYFTTTQLAQIEFASKERVGLSVLREFVPIYAGLLKTQNASIAESGGFDAGNRFQEGKDQTNSALSAFEKFLADTHDELHIQSDFDKLKTAWVSTASFTGGASDDARAVFDPANAAMLTVINRIGDNSNLVLDPDVDSFYLINSLVLGFPQLAEGMGQLWGWGTYGVTRSGLSLHAAKKYAIAVAGVESSLLANRSYLERAIAANPDIQSKLNLAPFDAAAAFLSLAGDPDAFLAEDGLKAGTFYDQGEAATLKVLSFYNNGIPVLDGLLSLRVDAMVERLFLIAGFCSLMIVVAAYLFYCFFLVTRGGLNQIRKCLKELAQGDLRITPPTPWGKDEAAGVLSDAQTTFRSLNILVTNLNTSASSLFQTSDEIAEANEDLSDRTRSTAASLEIQATTICQISSQVGKTAERAHMAAGFAQENANLAESGDKAFGDVVTTMANIHSMSSQINDIIGVINGIAFQTNILALNAAVEAARAGERGRGFAVVATEVRNLAGRSAIAANDIKALIKKTTEQINIGSKTVNESSGSLQSLMTNAKQINVFLNEISIAAREQATGIEQVGYSVQQLDINTQQNAAMVLQATSSSSALREQALDLQDEIARFKVA